MHKTAKHWYFVTKIYRSRPNFTKQLQISHKRRKNKQFSRNFLLSCHFSTPVSIDIDGNSYKAVKLSGELQIESSSAITTSNDGGTTTVTGTQNSFKDGF